MRRRILFVSLLLITAPGLACSKQSSEQPSNNASRAANLKDEVPPAVKAAFQEAKTVTAQSKDLTDSQIASVEKESGAKLNDKVYHSFVANDGSNKQIGTATVLDVEGASEPIQLVVAYRSDGAIKKVVASKGTGDLASAAFLDQFAGKGHHDAFQVGGDIRYEGSNRAGAEAVARAVKRDVLTMQQLYGKAHGH